MATPDLAELSRLFAINIDYVEAALDAMTPEEAEAIMFEANARDDTVEYRELIRNAAAERAGWGDISFDRRDPQQPLSALGAVAEPSEAPPSNPDDASVHRRGRERHAWLQEGETAEPGEAPPSNPPDDASAHRRGPERHAETAEPSEAPPSNPDDASAHRRGRERHGWLQEAETAEQSEAPPSNPDDASAHRRGRERHARLQEAETAYRRSTERTRKLREQRDAAVRAAIADGMSYAQISEITGLTRARVGRIALW